MLTNVKPDISVYYPNVIGKESPGSATTCGILVEGRDDGKGSVPLLAMGYLLKRGARILSQTSYVSAKHGDFTLTLLCDLGATGATLDDIVIELRKIKRVSSAQSISLKHQMFDGFLFPLVLMDSYRVVAVSSNLMFDLQENIRLPSERVALLEAGRHHGKDIVEKLREKLESGPDGRRNQAQSVGQDILQENVTRYMKASGWGKLSWEDGETLERVILRDPPTPKNQESSVAGNLFIEGLIAGLAEALFSKRFSVIEDHYDSFRRILTIGLAEQSIAVQMEAQNQKTTLSPEENDRIQSEIQRLSAAAEQLGVTKQTVEKVITIQATQAPLAQSVSHVAVVSDGRLEDRHINKPEAGGVDAGPEVKLTENVTQQSKQTVGEQRFGNEQVNHGLQAVEPPKSQPAEQPAKQQSVQTTTVPTTIADGNKFHITLKRMTPAASQAKPTTEAERNASASTVTEKIEIKPTQEETASKLDDLKMEKDIVEKVIRPGGNGKDHTIMVEDAAIVNSVSPTQEAKVGEGNSTAKETNATSETPAETALHSTSRRSKRRTRRHTQLFRDDAEDFSPVPFQGDTYEDDPFT